MMNIFFGFQIKTLMEIYNTYVDEQAAGDSSKNFLPEPPEVRERLLKEIKFFVNGIREQAHLQGRLTNINLVLKFNLLIETQIKY